MDELTLWPCPQVFTCKQCGQQFEWSGRNKRRYCPSCAKDRANASNRRRYAKIHIEVCEECGQEFSLSGKRARYLCPGCVRDVRRAVMLAAREERRTRLVECGFCRVEFKTISPTAMFCSTECRTIHYAVNRRAASLAARPEVECPHCHDKFLAAPRQRFCSRKCSADFWNAHHNANRKRERPPRECLACGTESTVNGRALRKFCSTRCRIRFAASKVLAMNIDDINDRAVFERDGWKCQICRKKVDPSLEWPDPMSASLDHIQPRSKDGDHVYANVRLAHLRCNLQKSAGTGPDGDQTLLFGHI